MSPTGAAAVPTRIEQFGGNRSIDTPNDRTLPGAGRILLGFALTALGVLNVAYADFALQWQPAPASLPGRGFLAVTAGVITLACGAGLLWHRAVSLASKALLPLFIIWWLLLKLPQIIAAPAVELSWLGAGEIAVLVAGGLVLRASTVGYRTNRRAGPGGETGIRLARLLFGLALIPIGLSHFAYAKQAIALVPSWLPARPAWSYLAGAGHLAAGLGVICSVLPRLAAQAEAAMLGIFTVLVWVPGVVHAGVTRLQWTAMVMSWVITAAAWVVADSYQGIPWIDVREH